MTVAGVFEGKLARFERAHDREPNAVTIAARHVTDGKTVGIGSGRERPATVTLSADALDVFRPLVGTEVLIRVTFEVVEPDPQRGFEIKSEWMTK